MVIDSRPTLVVINRVNTVYESYMVHLSLYCHFTDLRSSRCYLQIEERNNRNRCSKEMGEPVTKATCCCSVGKAWGPKCELCPLFGSDEYKQLCPGGTGYRPNSITVKKFFFY